MNSTVPISFVALAKWFQEDLDRSDIVCEINGVLPDPPRSRFRARTK